MSDDKPIWTEQLVGRIGAHRVRAKRPDGSNSPLQSPQLVATTRRRVTASPPTRPTSCRHIAKCNEARHEHKFAEQGSW